MVDGSKLNLPRALTKNGYRVPNAWQGSAKLPVKSKIPVDFFLMTTSGRRRSPIWRHDNDVVVRG